MEATAGRTRPQLGRNATAVASYLLIALFSVLILVPWAPPGNAAEPDFSLGLFLHQAFASRADFGAIVTPFGPWGFLYRGIHPLTLRVHHLCWTLIALANGLALFNLARRLARAPMALLIAGGAVGAVANGGADAVLLLPLFLAILAEGSGLMTLAFLLGVLVAFAGLIKLSCLAAGVAVLAALAVRTAVAHRRISPAAAGAAAAVFPLWFASGQGLSSFVPWLRHSLLMLMGYADAAALTSPGSTTAAIFFVLGVLALAAFGFAQPKQRHRLLAAAPLLLLAFIVFKNSFVRADDQHTMIGAALLLAAAPLLVFRAPDGASSLTRSARRAAVGLAALSLLLALPTLADRAAQVRGTLWNRSLIDLRERVEAVREEIPATLTGRSDAYPNGAALLAAAGHPISPRPVIESPMCWREELAELNAAHLRGGGAPDTILLHLHPIDQNLATEEDSLSWIEFAGRYELAGEYPAGVVLRRLPAPRRMRLVPLLSADVAAGQAVILPPAAAPIVARIVVRRTLWDRIRSVLVRPARLSLVIDGHPYHLVPAVAEAGIIVSPLIRDASDVSQLFNTTMPSHTIAVTADAHIELLRLDAQR